MLFYLFIHAPKKYIFKWNNMLLLAIYYRSEIYFCVGIIFYFLLFILAPKSIFFARIICYCWLFILGRQLNLTT